MGVKVPSFENIEFDIKKYAFLGKPHWVDLLVDYLKEALELHARIQVSEQRLQIIKEAVRIVTQRVNLFEKVLIPRTRENIKKIHIYLSDQERAGVVRAKLAKRKKIKTG